MAVAAFGPGGDAPGDVDDDVKLTLLSQRPMVFQYSEVKVQDRVGALETAVDDAVDHGLPPDVPRCCAISSFARILMYSVGCCSVSYTHLTLPTIYSV